MLTLIDAECNVDVNKNIGVQSNVVVKSNTSELSNVLQFRSQEIIETESRQKAIEAITKKSQQLHW